MKLHRNFLLIGLVVAAVAIAHANEVRALFPKTDCYLVRTDKAGLVVRARTYSFGHETRCYAATTTRLGGFVLAGSADSCYVGEGKGAACRVLVVDSTGQVIWQRCYVPETVGDYRSCHTLVQISGGDLVVAGRNWMFCVSEAGDLRWSHIYDLEESKAMVPSPDGGFVLVGTVEGKGGGQGHGGWVLKTDAQGQERWRQSFHNGRIDYVYNANISADGRIVVVGEAYDSDSPMKRDADGWVVILDSQGNIEQNRTYGRSVGMRLWNVWNAPSGEFLLYGEITWPKEPAHEHSDDILMRISASGDSLWSRRRHEGWITDSEDTVAGSSLSIEYLNQVMLLQASCNLHPLPAVAGKMAGVSEALRSQGFAGFAEPVEAGILPDGYFEAGWVEKTLRHDTTGTR